ncbi:hypothetical protein B0H11DRAFT_2182158 [Mycena galericulata]|nr:hypothetical protein B0H11DRAFT_2182158 [Mycena galericulata]
MDDSQWCLDECPTCATVVHGSSVYCEDCEPDVKEVDLEDGYEAWNRRNTATRVSAWALDCYKSTVAPGTSPCVFPSPSRRKLYLRKQHPTSWVTPDASLDFPSSILSSARSTPTAIESRSTMTAPPSPNSRCLPRSWACPSQASVTRPLLTRTNVYLSPGFKAHQPAAEPPDHPGTPPSGSWFPPSDVECTRPDSPMLNQKQHRRDDRAAHSFRKNPS